MIDQSLDLDLLFSNIPTPINIYNKGQFSTEIGILSDNAISEIAYPTSDKRPPIKELSDMQERDPVVQQCLTFIAMRAVQSFGNYSHTNKDIETFINSNLKTLNKALKRTLFKIITSVALYGYCIAEYTFTSKARGFRGQWRLNSINVLNPEKIVKFIGVKGKIQYIVYDNGNGKQVNIPYKKCLHIVNNSGSTFDEKEIFGIGYGISALNYYKLKRVVLTQLALATKNNSTGIIHAKVPNTGKTILVDSKMNPLKDAAGKTIEVTKQIALNYQLQDLHKKDFIVTDIDVELNRIQIQNDERFWEYVLNYIDRSIQRSFNIPIGIFDSGTTGIQDIGLSKNYKSVFDSTIYSLTALLKEELTSKIIKKLLYFNFPLEKFKQNYGDFIYDVEEDETTKNNRLSTVASLIASGLLDQNDVEVISLIRKNLGLPALNDTDKESKKKDQEIAAEQKMQQNIQTEIQAQLAQLQAQMQIQQMMQPPQPDPNAAPPEGETAEATEDYPEGS